MFPNLLGQKAFHKLSSEDMGKIAGITRQTFENKMETGKFTAEECKAYCRHFSMPFDFLFATDEELPKT